MDLEELEKIVKSIVRNRKLDGKTPYQLMQSIYRKSFPADALPIVEPLLKMDRVTVIDAMQMIGKMKGDTRAASQAIEAAWDRTWEHGVPQTCEWAFPALLRLGENDKRLLKMIRRALKVDNYGIHKQCAEALMKIDGGDAVLEKWDRTIPGKCDCNLHTKLKEKIAKHLAA